MLQSHMKNFYKVTKNCGIPIFEKFVKAGVNHFVIRFWGKNYFGSIDKFASHVIPYFKEQNK